VRLTEVSPMYVVRAALAVDNELIYLDVFQGREKTLL
jgi:hypothetical protein